MKDFTKEKEMDVSQDFITYRTICPVSKKDKKLYKQILEKQSKDYVVLEENHLSKESLNKKSKKHMMKRILLRRRNLYRR